MKKIISLFIVIFSALAAHAQLLEPVTVVATSKDLGKGNFELSFDLKLEEGWHVFSQFIGDGGPIASSINFENKNGFDLNGKPTEIGNKVEMDEPLFQNMHLVWFEKNVTFKQKIKLTSPSAEVKGYFEYQTCNDRSCLPPTDVDFDFKLTSQSTNNDGGNNSFQKNPVDSSSQKNLSNDCACAQQVIDSLIKSGALSTSSVNGNEIVSTEDENVFVPIDTASVRQYENAGGGSNGGGCSNWLKIFLQGFAGGLIALLTPCVFPMIPLTVSFFLKRSGARIKAIRNAVTYGLSIILIYVFIGFLVTLIMGPNGLNQLSTNALFNLVFFFIFVVFALSFFGAFEITLPSAWVNKSESMSDRGGLIGIFFMAFTLALVSFSCTGPIIGGALVEAAVGSSNCGPLVIMTGFATALALPFALFAMFPQLLQSLPKSGGWLNTVKVTIGFLELALSLKFLSVPDLTYHWHILDREVFLVLWITIFALLGIYLIGWMKFVHDSDVPHVTIPRLFFAIAAFSFSMYLIPGLWGAPLKVISGLTPPISTQDLNLAVLTKDVHKSSENKKYSDIFHAPPGINAYFDYNQAMAVGRAEKKPVMIDFTGWGCVNCRKMEEYVWSKSEVSKLINDNYVLVSLYVDDRTMLPESERYTSATTGQKIRTLGNKLADFETTYIRKNSQPYYVLLDNNGKLLAPARAFDLNVEAYITFLQSGIQEYKKRK